MAPALRTHDGHPVRIGDEVWAQNGTGPFTITEPPWAPRGYLLLIETAGSGDERLHKLEDIEEYYYLDRPSQPWER